MYVKKMTLRFQHTSFSPVMKFSTLIGERAVHFDELALESEPVDPQL